MRHLILLIARNQGFNLGMKLPSPPVINMLLLVRPIPNHFNHLQMPIDFARGCGRPLIHILLVRRVRLVVLFLQPALLFIKLLFIPLLDDHLFEIS